MKKLIFAVGAVAAGLAVACAYLLSQIEVERGRTRAEVERREEMQARVNQLEREQAASATQASSMDVSRSVGENLSPSSAASPPEVAPRGTANPAGNDPRAWRRRMLNDPAGRELLRAQQRAKLHASNPTLARDLGLTKDEYDRLLELLADTDLQRMELFAREDSVSAKLMNKVKELDSNHDRYVADLLGDEKARQYRKYVASQPVRAEVSQFRARLGEADALQDSQAARLVTVLQDQRERFANDLKERYAGHSVTTTTSTWYGGWFMASDTMNTSAEEQMLAQMEDYNRRLIQGAASVLSPNQLEVFKQIQDESLAYQRVQFRQDAGARGP